MWTAQAGVQTFCWYTEKSKTREWKGLHSLVRPGLSTQQGLNSWQPSLNLQWELTPIYAESVVRDMVLFYGISSSIMNGKDLEKTLMLGKIEGKRRRGQQRMRWLDGWYQWLNGHELEQTLGDNEGQGSLVSCSPWGGKDQTGLSGWTTTESTELGTSQQSCPLHQTQRWISSRLMMANEHQASSLLILGRRLLAYSPGSHPLNLSWNA